MPQKNLALSRQLRYSYFDASKSWGARRAEAAVNKAQTLSELQIGEQGVIADLDCEGRQRRRLQDLGFLPGTPVEAVLRAMGGDPTGYRVRGTVIALRSGDAAQIRLLAIPTE